MELLGCKATRELFLQACREMFCEECALYILSVEQARQEGMFDKGKMDKATTCRWLDRLYGDVIQAGAIYEIPIAEEFRSHVVIPTELFPKSRLNILPRKTYTGNKVLQVPLQPDAFRRETLSSKVSSVSGLVWGSDQY